MSLANDLPEEVVEELALLVHEGNCADHLGEEFEEVEDDDDERDSCLADDTQLVREMLQRLEQAGVSYSPTFLPMKGAT